MAKVEFQFNGINSIIQCNEEQSIYEICNNFLYKSHLSENDVNFVYNGRNIEFDNNLSFTQIANSNDKERKKMNILVLENEDNNINKKTTRAKNIICPRCGEDAKIEINDNYKINLFECRNNHAINNILFNNFEKTQMIDLTKIKCGICKEKNKHNTYNNKFYKCYECNMNICPLCKLKHDKEHNIINYDKAHYICNKHREIIINYCTECKMNICSICEKDHLKHNKQSIIKMSLDKDELLANLEKLKKSMNLFQKNINKIIELLNSTKDYLDNYYQFAEYFFNNYNLKERNYEILYNADKILNFNNILIKIINKINNDKDFLKKFSSIYYINKKINSSEIKLTLKIDSDDINKKIYFLDNTDGDIVTKVDLSKNSEYGIEYIKEEHHHDFLKELNESNTELYINNKKYKFEKCFLPKKEGNHDILLKFHNVLKNSSYMFYGCDNIISIDLSAFNSQKVTNMSGMFYGCSNLTNVDFNSINTDNVTNVSGMFAGCSKLTNLDLSSFNTEKVTNMSLMFAGCNELSNINISRFNTINVNNMFSMFYGCSNLSKIDLSSFNVEKVINMSSMFESCYHLINLDLSSFNTKNVINMCNMFNTCCRLTNIDLSKFDTQNVENMSGMFGLCYSLLNINLSSFNTKNVTDMSSMYDRCSNLTSIDLSSFNTEKVANISGMFYYCNSIKNINMSSFNNLNIDNIEKIFENCLNLKEIKLNKNLDEKIKEQIDEKITKIEYVE